MIQKGIAYFIIVAIFTISCKTNTEVKDQSTERTAQDSSAITVSYFGEMADGTPISMYTLVNTQGATMKVINYGGIITSLTMPDRAGRMEDIVLGYDSLESYVTNNPFFGALIGRYGNRIAKGKFSLDGTQYTLAVNNGENHLHGGIKGFDKVVWNIEEHSSEQGAALKLSYLSKDGEEGYPGNLDVEVIYTLTNKNELLINYKATTDKKTIVNLTQHSYFNLSGDAQPDILSHELTLNANRFLPVDKTLIPTGELKNVEGTPFDFLKPMKIGTRINEKDQQLQYGNGYDHCWILNQAEDGLNNAGTLYDSASGREMTVYTSEPGIQFYSGNFLDGTLKGKNRVYNFRSGLCLETQHFPDSPNRKEFPSVELNPGEIYTSETVYRFSTR